MCAAIPVRRRPYAAGVDDAHPRRLRSAQAPWPGQSRRADKQDIYVADSGRSIRTACNDEARWSGPPWLPPNSGISGGGSHRHARDRGRFLGAGFTTARSPLRRQGRPATVVGRHKPRSCHLLEVRRGRNWSTADCMPVRICAPRILGRAGSATRFSHSIGGTAVKAETFASLGSSMASQPG